jgi:NADH-quinone oxidoreductase subunit C
MIDLTAVDWPERQPRFDLVAHFQNLVSQERLRVKAAIAEGQAAPSITSIHKGALWFEREIFDMFGIQFDGHPDLKRLMMWEGFKGHPLRKDFKLDGGDAWCALDMGASYSETAKSLAE